MRMHYSKIHYHMNSSGLMSELSCGFIVFIEIHLLAYINGSSYIKADYN